MQVEKSSHKTLSGLAILTAVVVSLLALMTFGTTSASAQATRAQDNAARQLLPVQVDGRWGYIDRTGTIVIKPQFGSAEEFRDGRAFVRYPAREKPRKPGETSVELIAGEGFIDETGKVVIELESPLYLGGNGFFEGLTRFWTGQSGTTLYGFIDTSGKVKIKPQFTHAYEFVEGLSAVCIDQKCGFIDKTGEFVIAPKYRLNASFSDGMAIVGLDINTIGFCDRTGEMVIAPQFGYMGSTVFREGLSAVAYPWGKYGFIDKKGVIVIPMQFDFAQPFSEGLAAVSVNDKWGYIDKTGKFVIEPQFQGAGPFSEGLAPIGGNASATAIDPALAINEPPTGYIDKTGKMVITIRFERASSFTNGIARIAVDSNKWGYIDKTGNYFWKPSK